MVSLVLLVETTFDEWLEHSTLLVDAVKERADMAALDGSVSSELRRLRGGHHNFTFAVTDGLQATSEVASALTRPPSCNWLRWVPPGSKGTGVHNRDRWGSPAERPRSAWGPGPGRSRGGSRCSGHLVAGSGGPVSQKSATNRAGSGTSRRCAQRPRRPDRPAMVTCRPGSVSVAGQRRADGADRKRPGGEAWGHSLGCRAAASREGGHSQRTTKAGRTHSLPLLTYSRPGGLRQAPGRAAESAAGPRTNEDMGAGRGCVVVDLWGTR